MKGLSKKEIEVVSDLEFQEKYYFSKSDIKNHFDSDKQTSNMIYNLRKKGRIVRLNRDRYFLVPIKARIGKWTDDPYIIIDEICNGKDYYIGGWAAANYWRLTDQIPMRFDVYTTRRQGRVNILSVRMVFHRIRKESLRKIVRLQTKNHGFNILNKEESKKWMKLRQ